MLNKLIIKIYIYISEVYGFLWDKIRSLDTEKNHSLAELNLSSKRSVGYRPSEIPIFYKIMKSLDIRESDVFLDLGAGKGRVMVLAGHFPFRRVIGVEISDKLVKICERNLEVMKNKKKYCDFSIIHDDAANYRIPHDVTIVYCYNPFQLEVLNKVILHIKESVRNNPRTVRLIYYNPMFSDEIEKKHGLVIDQSISLFSSGLYGSWCNIYKI